MRDEFDTLFVAMLTDAKAEELVEEVEYFPRQIQCLKLKAVEAGKERPSDRDAALEVLRGVSKLFKQLQQAIRSDEENISEDIKDFTCNACLKQFLSANSHECAGCGYDECDECFDAAVAAAAES